MTASLLPVARTLLYELLVRAAELASKLFISWSLVFIASSLEQCFKALTLIGLLLIGREREREREREGSEETEQLLES